MGENRQNGMRTRFAHAVLKMKYEVLNLANLLLETDCAQDTKAGAFFLRFLAHPPLHLPPASSKIGV